MSEEILFDVADRVATITLNNPEKRNAFTLEMVDYWADRLIECHERDDIHVVVMTGAGKAFCSGGDVSGLMKARAGRGPVERKRELTAHVHRIPLTLERMEKPVLVAINGVATGAGLDIALMGDIRYAAQSARFAETYLKMGLVPGAGGAYFLPRAVGVQKALEMFWTSEFVDAETAKEIGLVTKVLPDDELMPAIMALAKTIADGPTLAVRAIKRAIYQSQTTDLRTSLDLISSHYAMIATGNDHAEAVDAFLEKRSPRFTGS